MKRNSFFYILLMFFFFGNKYSYAQLIPDNFVQKDYNISSGVGGSGIEAADIDGDGKIDLVLGFVEYLMAPPASNISFVRIYRNEFDSYCMDDLSSKTDVFVGEHLHSLAIGDLDNDGKQDIVAVARQAKLIYVLKNNCNPGSISLSDFSITSFPTAYEPQDVAIGDIDNDTKPDIITSNFSVFSVFKNSSTTGTISASSFTDRTDFSVTPNFNTLAVDDLDGDGKKDVVVAGSYANHSDSSVFVFRNQSTTGVIDAGSFSAAVKFIVGYEPISPVITDLNQDGKPEIVVANTKGTYTNNKATILINSSTSGTLDENSFFHQAHLNMVIDGNYYVPYTVALADLDSDGNTDLIFGDGNSIIIYINEITGSAINESLFSNYRIYGNGKYIVSANLDGDLANDIAFVDSYGAFLTIYDNNYFLTPLYSAPLVSPASKTVCPESNIVLEVPVIDSHYTYQWIEYPSSGGSVALTNTGRYTGTTTATLGVSAIVSSMSGSQYKCYINGNCAGGILSAEAVLTVSTPPLVVSGPVDLLVFEDSLASFNLLVSGDSLQLQWQEDRGAGFVTMDVSSSHPNVTGTSLSISNVSLSMNGYRYRCILKGSCDSIIVSNAAELKVISRPVILPEVEYPLEIFELLSPNGDNKNDFFYIENLDKYPDNEISIFNKWGQRVFYRESYQNNWDGENLSDGSYFYVVKIKKTDKVFRGNLVIRR